MNRNELVALYKKRSPLRKTHKAYKDHLSRIDKSKEPSDTYDQCICQAQKIAGRDLADKIIKQVGGPKYRKLTIEDVDALDMKFNRVLDPIIEEPLFLQMRLKADRGTLTKAEFYHLSTVLLNSHSTNSRFCLITY